MLDPVIQKLFNEFANSQPALQIPDQPARSANPKLGDLLAAALISLDAAQTATYTWDAAHAGPGSYAMNLALPAGAIVTALYTDVLTPLASGGAATIALKTGTAGADTLVAPQAYSAMTGTQKQTLAADPTKTATGGALLWVIAGAALTAGKVSVSVRWIAPQTSLGTPVVPVGPFDVPTNDLI